MNMEKEYLIKKWLDNDLSPEEWLAFRSLEDYESLTKLSKYTQRFSPPESRYEDALSAIDRKIASKKVVTIDWYKPLLRVAAVVAICFGVYFYTTTLDSTFSTNIGEKVVIELPDASMVDLNAVSQIRFNKKSWNKQREVILDGEAFFKVAKGSSFNVLTDIGVVTVLGTQFNVKQRKGYFEVTCYEGLVQVTQGSTIKKLHPGESFVWRDNKVEANKVIIASQPDWIKGASAFKSVPLRDVLAEFERYYNVSITTKDIDIDQLFTGKFAHKNITVAIESITQPLEVTYIIMNNTIILKHE